MKKILTSIFLALVFSGSIVGAAEFYANQEIQSLAPEAFALQPEARDFVLGLAENVEGDTRRLLHALNYDISFLKAFARWQELSVEEQIPYLKRVFTHQVEAMGIKAPELVFSDTLIPGAAYFDFDLSVQHPGRVILNPKALANEPNKLASLALLIHETRHSAQLQLALTSGTDAFSRGYRAAFRAQKKLQGKLSFCDFLTLLNEYEAFQFSNKILGVLSKWTIDMPDMGTFASQFDSFGNPKISLPILHLSAHSNFSLINHDGDYNVLEKFNELEKEQYDLLHSR